MQVDMRTRNRRKQFGLALLVLVLLPFGMMGWKVDQDRWQQQLDHAIVSASRRNDITDVAILLSEGADPNARDLPPDTRSTSRRIWDRLRGEPLPKSQAPTALLAALGTTVKGDVPPANFEVVKALVEAGGAVNVCNEEGTTPLMYAAMMPKAETAAFLLAKGTDVNATDDMGCSALHGAASTDRSAQALLLLAQGASVEARDNGGDTPLYLAVINGNTAVARTLLEKGAEVNARNTIGSTPLDIAATFNWVECVQLLLSRGAQVNVKDNNGETPLMHAQQYHEVSIIKMLKQAGAKK